MTIAAAGDIACSPQSDKNYDGGAGTAAPCQVKATADLILTRDVDAISLSDNQNATDRLGAFEISYKTRGRLKERIYPMLSNHDYLTTRGTSYYVYHDPVRNPEKDCYSFDLAAWHLVALNPNCDDVGYGEGSVKWLKRDLAGHQNKRPCADWQNPRFSTGRHDSDETYDGLQVLTDAGTALSGHDHNYERFAPQTPGGEAYAGGDRQFVVGTGGKGLRSMGKCDNKAFVSDAFGVLFLTHEDSYDWAFVSTSGETLDSGTGSC